MIAGLIDEHKEYFLANNIQFLADAGQVKSLPALCTSFTSLLSNQLYAQPLAVKKLNEMGFTTHEEKIIKYFDCNYSEADDQPDVLACGSLGPREFKRCPNRGNCLGENVVCATPYLLTIKEVQVLKYIGLGLLDKEICEVLAIAKDTLRCHKDHISVKTNSSRKAQLAIIAHQLNLV